MSGGVSLGQTLHVSWTTRPALQQVPLVSILLQSVGWSAPQYLAHRIVNTGSFD